MRRMLLEPAGPALTPQSTAPEVSLPGTGPNGLALMGTSLSWMGEQEVPVPALAMILSFL